MSESMAYQIIEAADRRRRNIRIVLFTIILGTLPLYCAGFLLWGTAPQRTLNVIVTPLATFTPIGSDITVTVGLPTVTPLGLSPTLLSPLQPTPLQFMPINRPPPAIPTETPFLLPIIPTSTLAPSLTPFPTNTLPPIEAPTDVPPPIDVPVVPTVEVPTGPPTNTPLPFDEPTVDPGTGGS
jgi:hypothetical protein